MRLAPCLALLLGLLLPALQWAQEAETPEQLLRRTAELAAGGDGEAAVAAYREWLQAGGEEAGYGEVLLRAVGAATELAGALRLLADFTPRVRDPAAREACLERQVELLRLAGRIEEALGVQLSLPETPGRLVERATLCLELGLTGEAEEALRRIGDAGDAETPAVAQYLLAMVYLATDRAGPAEATLRSLYERYPDAQVVPAALLALGEALRGRGEAKAQVLGELKARFPASPEAALAEAAARVRYAAAPLRLLPPGAPAPKAPVPYAGPAKALVQAGSFRDPENAQYLVRDLSARGFEARILEKAVGEARYYRVVIGPAQSPEKAQGLILRLKDAGFEGVLLLE
jgi:cell division septation protein DedD